MGRTKKIRCGRILSFQNYNQVIRVQHFIKNWWTPTENMSKILRIAMSLTQFSAWVPYSILSVTWTDLLYVKERKILATKKFFYECNGVIHLNKTYVQHPKRINDVSIMHLANTQTMHKVTMNKKEKINCVRMYLGVQCVSEISIIDGASFVMGVLEGDNYQFNYQITLTKPH